MMERLDHPPRVLTVVLNWRQADMTLRCLRHVANQTVASRVLVIDNGSRDGSVDRFIGLAGDRRVIALESNVGFAAGMNSGIEIAIAEHYDYVWLLNNDVFSEPDCLERLVSHMEKDPGCVIAGPTLFWEDGREQPPGAKADWNAGGFESLSVAEFVSDSSSDLWLMGAAPLVRVTTLRAVGGFDPQFFAYMEDADLGLRLKKSGKIALVTSARATHLGGTTSGGYYSAFCQFLMIRNSWLFMVRNAPAGSQIARWLRFCAKALGRAEMYQAQGHPQVALGVLAGLTAARRQRYGAPAALTDAGWIERQLFRHPTRFGRWLGSAATAFQTVWAWRCLLRELFHGRPTLSREGA